MGAKVVQGSACVREEWREARCARELKGCIQCPMVTEATVLEAWSRISSHRIDSALVRTSAGE